MASAEYPPGEGRHAARAAARPQGAGPPWFVYVGTSTGDASEGIYTLRFDPEGEEGLARIGAVEPILNPSFLALSPDASFLYAVSEQPAGSVSAYRIDARTGALTRVNEQPSGGSGPAYVSTDRTGAWVLVANYGSGTVALLPASEEGRLGEATDVVQHEGRGPNRERQEGPHAHYIHAGPGNRYVYAADLGADQVPVYALDAENGRLVPAAAPDVEVPPGTGPRHLDFHPNGRWAYLVSELSGTVTAYARDAATGALDALQTISALPEGFGGFNKSADLHVHPSGRWLYVSNRGDADGIARFAIDDATGRLTLAGRQTEGIDWPRNFAIAPSGRYLLVANRHADEVVAFGIDTETGRLSATGYRAAVPSPTNVTFGGPGSP